MNGTFLIRTIEDKLIYHTQDRSRLDPETTESLVYIYANRTTAAQQNSDQPKMFTWDNEVA